MRMRSRKILLSKRVRDRVREGGMRHTAKYKSVDMRVFTFILEKQEATISA